MGPAERVTTSLTDIPAGQPSCLPSGSGEQVEPRRRGHHRNKRVLRWIDGGITVDGTLDFYLAICSLFAGFTLGQFSWSSADPTIVFQKNILSVRSSHHHPL